jgi:hypothetical protein
MPKQQPWRDGQQHEGYIVKGERHMPVFLNANQAIESNITQTDIEG